MEETTVIKPKCEFCDSELCPRCGACHGWIQVSLDWRQKCPAAAADFLVNGRCSPHKEIPTGILKDI